MIFRAYEPSVLPGRKVPIARIADRRALIGKFVHYDIRGSVYARAGRVTGATRYEIEIDGSPIAVGSVEQMTVEDCA